MRRFVSRAALGVACAAAALGGAPARAPAQESSAALVSVSVKPETVTVGQPFSVRIRVRAPAIATVRFPAVPDTADAIEAVDPRAIEDAGRGEMLDRTAVYRLVAWDVGNHTPRFANVTVSESGADKQYTVTAPTMVVLSVLPADTTDRKPKAMRDPVRAPSGWWRYVLLLVVLAVSVASHLLWKKKRRVPVVPPEPEPFAAATLAFDAVNAMALPALGEPGSHVIASTDVLRAYLGRRFPDLGDSLTVPEIESVLREADLPILPERLLRLLERETAIRFARSHVTTDEALALGRESRLIVEDIQEAYVARVRSAQRLQSQKRRR